MKLKNILVFLLLLFLSGSVFAQIERDKDGAIDIKKLSREDYLRLRGNQYMLKTAGDSKLIKESIINGNKITVVLYNYASITSPTALPGTDLVWNNLGYGFEFGPLAAGQVASQFVDSTGTIKDSLFQIVSDSFIDERHGDYSPSDVKWGWLPKEGYVDPDQDEIATLNAPDTDGDGKPDSWPERWYSEGAGQYIWPAFLGDQATAPDEEVFFVVDDYTNAEFPYYPFTSDSSKRGLGLDMEVRIIQFNNPLAEDILFLVYKVTNASEKTIPEAYFGMHGDPHVGGSGDYSDDYSGFVDPEGNSTQQRSFPQRARSMVYSWDIDQVGAGGRKTGYFGWKFLESPSIDDDMEDNDYDGITDESFKNTAGEFIDGTNYPLTYGISDLAQYTAVFGEPVARWMGDEDGDWDPARHDVGIDGIGLDSPNYPGPDYGENDGKPSQAWYQDANGNDMYDEGEPIQDEYAEGFKWAGSEPNFGFRDISESDQLGLTSFHAATYSNTSNVPKQDELMWEWLSEGEINVNGPGMELLGRAGDNVFNFGTGGKGDLSLAVGASQRFSMCILFGDDLSDLILNAETSTKVLEADYRFAQPPTKPVVTAVPGDGKVTLYWDRRAEESVDPLTGQKDFLGYKIYRSQDYTFSDLITVTDARGNPFMREAFVNPETGEMALWHTIIPKAERATYPNGFHPVEFPGRGVRYYIGDPADESGIVHEFVDSSVTNGINYYYAVVAYDNGSIVEGEELPPSETQSAIRKDAITGNLLFDVNTVSVTPNALGAGVIDAEAGIGGHPQRVVGNSTGEITIRVLNDVVVPEGKVYAVEFQTDSIYSVLDSTGVTETFSPNDTKLVGLSKSHIKEGTVEVKDAGGNIVPADSYVMNYDDGKIASATMGSLNNNELYTVSFRYYPVYRSSAFDSLDVNPAFDGMKIYVENDKLELDTVRSEFNNKNLDVITEVRNATRGSFTPYRADWEIRFNDLDTLADGSWVNVSDTVMTASGKNVVTPFEVWQVNPTLEPAAYIIIENEVNGKWDLGEPILMLPTGPISAKASYEAIIARDTLDTAGNNLPGEGDIFFVRTNKPYQAGDRYVFETEAAEFVAEKASGQLDQIHVVPNPYVAYSASEVPGGIRTDSRGEKDLQFRGLPPECTIRIYTITGELVDEIYKNDMSSIAHWNLLSFEGQRVAFGVYIYHVDAPGVGEKIGKFALIK